MVGAGICKAHGYINVPGDRIPRCFILAYCYPTMESELEKCFHDKDYNTANNDTCHNFERCKLYL